VPLSRQGIFGGGLRRGDGRVRHSRPAGQKIDAAGDPAAGGADRAGQSAGTETGGERGPVMNTWLSLLSSWLVDVLVLGTVVLILALAAMAFLRQPAARMTVAWGAMLGLALLCVLAALPLWPRHALFPATNSAT